MTKDGFLYFRFLGLGSSGRSCPKNRSASDERVSLHSYSEDSKSSDEEQIEESTCDNGDSLGR